MLNTQNVHAFIPTLDFAKAKAFYGETLGLKQVSENPYAMEFDANGTLLRITLVRELNPHPFTVLGWGVTNIEDEMRELAGKGVVFEKFGLPGQNDKGVWQADETTKVAWFKDPDGNLLSLASSPAY